MAYHRSNGLVSASPEAAVVHCCDYRFQAAIPAFLRQELTLQSYDLLAIPGGPHFASSAVEILIPKLRRIGKDSVKFLIEQHRLNRLILIDHADCAFFRARLGFFFPEPSFAEKQQVSLRQAHRVLQSWFPQATVEAYLAEARGDQSVGFTRAPG